MKNDDDITDLPVLGQDGSLFSDMPVLGGVAPAPRGDGSEESEGGPQVGGTGASSSPHDEIDSLPKLGVLLPLRGNPRPPPRGTDPAASTPLGAAVGPSAAPAAPAAVVGPSPAPQAPAAPSASAASLARPQAGEVGGVDQELARAPVVSAVPVAPTGGSAPKREGVAPAVEPAGVRLGGYGDDVAEAPIADVLVVRGTGKVVVPPDSACVEFHVEARGSTAEAARGKGAETLEAALAAVKGVVVSGKSPPTLRTESVRTYPEYERGLHDFDEDRMRKVVGYHARGSVSVTIREVESATALASAVAQVMDAASKAGATIGGVSFDLDKPEQASCDALGLAVADARRTADVLARAAGVALGRLHSMVEDPPHHGYGHRGITPMAAMALHSKSAAPTPVEAGDVTVVRGVTCRWRFGSVAGA